MQIEQTKTVSGLVNHIQAMPDSLQQEIFDFVDFLRMRRKDDNQAMADSLEQSSIKKRQFGICKGKGGFAIKDDFGMTE